MKTIEREGILTTNKVLEHEMGIFCCQGQQKTIRFSLNCRPEDATLSGQILQKEHNRYCFGVEPAIVDAYSDSVKTLSNHVQPEVVIEQLHALPKTYTREPGAAANTRIRLKGCQCVNGSTNGG